MDDNNVEQSLLEQLYSRLTPKGFELLIEVILGKLGFDEIEITGKSGDSGVDLKAVLRKSEIPGIETNITYNIQAKRFKPDTTLQPSIIRELRGSIQNGERGILITTAKVSRKSIEEEAQRDISRLVLVIDGEKLRDICKQYEIAIVKRYEIDKSYLDKIESNIKVAVKISGVENITATKFVTDNDIRARILRIPKDVKLKIGQNSNIALYFNETTKEVLNIDKTGTYIGGVTEIFRKYGLIGSDGKYIPKVSVWGEYKDGFMVKFTNIETKNLIA